MVNYSTGTPTETGVYATRINHTSYGSSFLLDQFLLWYEGRWWYLGSDQRCRYEVRGWVGPLQRKMADEDDEL